MEDGDIVTLVDPINGPEDVTEFLREEGIWTGSNDFEDLELDPDGLKSYIEDRDPRDLLVERAQGVSKAATSDTPVGTRVAFTLGGADGTGRITGVDTGTDTAEVSVAEGTVELPLDALTLSSADLEDGPSDVYAPPATPISQQLPDSGRAESGPLTADEQFAYNEARARLSLLLSRENRQAAAAEIEDLETFIGPLHERALEEFSGTLEATDSAAGSDSFPVTDAPTVSAPLNGATDLSSRAAELYGPSEPEISSINADLRAGYADDDVLALQDVVLSSEITDNVSLFRGEYVPIEIAAQIVPGRALRNDSFMAPTKSSEAAEEHLARVVEPEDAIGKIPVSFRIEAEAGAPGIDLSAQAGHAQEVLLPAGVELVVTDVAWDESRGKLSVTASYDGTSVSSVADLTALEANPLKNADTTPEDLTSALQQTNEEVNKHQFMLAAARLSGEGADTAEDERKLARARAVRDSVAALIAARGGETPTPRRNATAQAKRITDPDEATALAQTIAGDDTASQLMRAALDAPARDEYAAVFVTQGADGEVVGAASTVDSSEVGEGSHVLISQIGARDESAGSILFNSILEDAQTRGRGVLLNHVDQDDIEYWSKDQGLAENPFEGGPPGYGLTAKETAQRVSQGQLDVPGPTEYGRFQLPERETTLTPGSVIDDAKDLSALPEQAWVGLSSATGPTELYQKDAENTWISSTSSEDDPALTDQELFALSSEPNTVIWFEEVSENTPEVESVPADNDEEIQAVDANGARIAEGDSVSTSDGEVSGVVERVEDDGEHIRVRDSDGATHRFPAGFLTPPNPSPATGEGVGTPNPLPNPTSAPGTGEGAGTPNQSDLRQRDGSGQPFASDGSGLALYVGYEVMDSDDPEYFGEITSIEEDGEHVNILGEDGTERRRKAEDLDLAVSIEIEIEE